MKNPLGEFGKTLVVSLAAFFVLSVSSPSWAAMYDPGAKWKIIRTGHFKINYPEKIEPIAQKAARILEEVYPEITAKWEWKPWGPTEVILTDDTDVANGMASVLPYNWMAIYVASPNPDNSLAHYDEWLRMLLVHEFTHIVQLDAYGGAWRPLRLIFQKTISPSGVDPTWMREGMAQYDETIFTRGGRGRGAFSEMVVRTSILEDTFPPIDVADGLSWKPPGYKSAYVFGLKFIQWLIDTYGEKKFLEFDKRVRSSILLSMINHQARNVYGKTFYELWREWQRSLLKRYAREVEELEKLGITDHEELVPNRYDEQYFAPAVSPDGKKMVYTVISPHTVPQIRVMDLETGKSSVLLNKRSSSQFSWSSDGTEIVFSVIGKYKRYYMYSDLWLYDFKVEKKRKRLKRLTTGARARDPEFFRDGKSILYVAGDMGTDVLKVYNIEKKESSQFIEDFPQFIQFANPRMSPDGRYFVISVWRPGDGWRIYRYDADGKNPMRLTTGAGVVIESRPVWTPDGEYVIFASDESGISNLYRASLGGGKVARLTNVLTGAFQPTGPVGSSVIAQGYHSEGFEIVKYAVPPPSPASKKNLKGKKMRGKGGTVGGASAVPNREGDATGGSAEGVSAAGDDLFKPEKYVAFGRSLFLPRFIIPSGAYADDTLFLSLMTGGTDALRWHRWFGGVTYRTDAKHIGYYLDYAYSRWRPSFGLGVMDYAVDFGNISFGDAQGNVIRTVHFYEHRRSFYTYVGVPLGRHSFNVAYFYEDHMPKTSLTAEEQAALNLGKFAGFRAGYRYGDAEKYSASISPENGRQIKLHTTWTNKAFGSADKNEQVIFAGDWREYVRLFRHNVLALRAGGGITWGDPVVQGTFGMGGAIGEGALAGGGSYTYFPFRGLPVSALSRTRAMLFSAEYRFPLLEPLRGLGTVPFFLKDISGALLVDYGNAWNAHENGCDSIKTFFDEFLLGVGTELRGDFIVGHGLPIHGRIGYAIIVVNRDRIRNLVDPLLKTDLEYGMLILALGTAF